MLGWKIRNLSITLLLASIVGLAAAQPSSVHDIDVDGSAGIFGRATHTGKFVGSTCKTNAECYSQNCAAVSGSTTKKCQRQPAGGPCFKDANCASRNCRASANICITPSKTNGTCSADKDCVSGLSCESGTCKSKVGSKCTKTGDCVSGSTCSSGVCGTPLLGANSVCNNGTQCLSGSCTIPSSCTNADGSYAYCDPLDFYGNQNICDRSQLGGKCVNPGDCYSGQCKNSICSNAAAGDGCIDPYQCGNLTCAYPACNQGSCGGGTCTFFGPGSQYPGDSCSNDAQCKSGKCVSDFPGSTCAGFANGATGCRTYSDCASGLCKSGTCTPGADGDRCIGSAQCQNVCSADGVCYTPKSPQSAGVTCKEAATERPAPWTAPAHLPSLAANVLQMATVDRVSANPGRARVFPRDPPAPSPRSALQTLV
ncbi:hypothetical protein OC846_004664 [Tilletia horrida]|uniref:Uncharacterized protein n=1 Tax=Tilletia horrida TaxID=155126 RepID=A0AAN6GPZ4_9BASI|nr:hypothetical protein OC846_004664 [Tilletia horrida]